MKKAFPRQKTPGEDIPDFLYKGAIVEAQGFEQTIKDVRADGGRLVLKFLGGGETVFDAGAVREIPGRAPVFLFEGAKLRVTDPDGRRHGMPPVLDWTVSSFGFQEDETGRQKLNVTLKIGKPPRYRFSRFDPRNMAPVEQENPFTLKKEIAVKRPMQFRPK